jgi:hypothetical protein
MTVCWPELLPSMQSLTLCVFAHLCCFLSRSRARSMIEGVSPNGLSQQGDSAGYHPPMGTQEA